MNFAPGGMSGAAGTGYAPVTYQRLMRLAARAFYNGPCPPPGRDTETFSARSKIAKMDTRGLGIVLVDYLTTVEWTSFELLSEALRLHPVVLSRALRFLEAGHMIRRYERRESRRKKRTVVGEALEADVAPEADSDDDEDEEGAKKKGLLTEYFTLDYARAFDALQIRIHTMRASLKEQLEATNAIQAYRCPGQFCGKTYTSLDAANLVDPMDLTFKCEMCGSELLEQRATNDAGEAAAQHATAKESKEAARKLLQAIDRELAPITRLMTELQQRSVPVPDPGELFEWAQRVKQREAEMAAGGGGGGGAGGGAAAAGGGAGRTSGAAAGSAGGGGASGSSAAPAALLAGSGVTVLSAADNTNTWEAQDFKVSLDGGGGGLLGGGVAAPGAATTAGGGKKAANVLPWFMKASDSKGAAGGGADEGAPAAAAAVGGTADGGAASADRGKQAEYFKDFMTYMTKLQKEKRAPKPEPGQAPSAAATGPYGTVKPEPGLAAAPPLGPVAAMGPAAAVAAPPPPLATVKQESGLYGAAAAAPVAAAAAAGGDLEWEDAGGLPPLAPTGPTMGGGVAVGGGMYGSGGGLLAPTELHPKVEEPIKTEPQSMPGFGGFGGASGGGGGGAAADEDVEWEDV